MRSASRILSLICLLALMGCLPPEGGPGEYTGDAAELARQTGRAQMESLSQLHFEAAKQIRSGRIRDWQQFHKYLKDGSTKARERDFRAMAEMWDRQQPAWDARRLSEINEQLGEGFRP